MKLTPKSASAGGDDQRRLTVAELAAALRAVAEAVAIALLGEPNRRLSNKRELRWGNNGSLRIHIAGPRKGTWIDEGSHSRYHCSSFAFCSSCL